MSASTRAGRLFVLAVGSIAAMSLLFAGGALAAGKPKSVSVEYVNPALNATTLRGKANPNGAATTLSFEQWNPVKLVWAEIGSKSIGAGTTVTSAEQFVTALTPQTETYFRVTAENSFGPSTSSELSFYSYWGIGEEHEQIEASTSQSGTFKMEFPPGAIPIKVECNEGGSGKINAGSKNIQSFSLNSCTTYDQGKVRCHPNPISFEINETELSPKTTWNIYCESEGPELSMIFTEPWTFAPLGSGLTAPVRMSTKAKGYTSTPIITVESKWNLSSPLNTKTLNWVLE